MKTNALTLIITLVVGVILAGSLLAPVISDAQTTIGDPITYNNNPTSFGEVYVTNDISGTHTVNMAAPNNYMTIDGQDIALNNTTRGFYVVTDKVAVMQIGAIAVICWADGNFQYNPNWGRTFDITFENGTATLNYTASGETTTYTYQYSWIGIRVAEGGNYINVSSSTPVYTLGTKSIIAMGQYTSGENDTYYVAKNGIVTISDPELYSSSITVSSTDLVSGTTDVNRAYPVISVGNETFTPYVWLAEKEVVGHESGGASYTLLGAIPILLIVALVMVAVGAIAYRRAD